MRIKTFSSYLEDYELQPLLLRDATAVVEGTNFFYRTYHDSQLSHYFGCDSHRYAQYLRKRLSMFKKANVKCYFLFKGGHECLGKTLQRKHDPKSQTFACPIFMREIYKEILDEMGFDYVICEYESKKDVIALGKKLECPIINYDIEFCFSQCQYIPCNDMKFNEHENAIECRYFHLKSFLEKHKLTEEKIAIFIVLMDSTCFPDGHFNRLFRHIKVPSGSYKRISLLLRWLSQQSHQQSMKIIGQFITEEEYYNFCSLKTKMLLLIQRKESGGAATTWLMTQGAPDAAGTGNWFASGVTRRHVAIDYVNLYRHKHFFGSRALQPERCQDDAMALSLDIVKYAFDLLTDYRYDEFIFVSDTKSGRQTMAIGSAYSTRKPHYEANVCVFENGWSDVRHLRLFQHFMEESLRRKDVLELGFAPRDARLLLAALLYYSRRRVDAVVEALVYDQADDHADDRADAIADAKAKVRAETRADAIAVLLSYVMLSHVFKKMDKKKLPKGPFIRKPVEDSHTDKDEITEGDCNIAAAIMEDYYNTSDEEVSDIYEMEMVYPLMQFQHCLSQLNDLNALCGAPLGRPSLRAVYAGPLVYKARRALGRRPRDALDDLLSPAPTVLAFLNGLIDLYGIIT